MEQVLSPKSSTVERRLFPSHPPAKTMVNVPEVSTKCKENSQILLNGSSVYLLHLTPYSVLFRAIPLWPEIINWSDTQYWQLSPMKPGLQTQVFPYSEHPLVPYKLHPPFCSLQAEITKSCRKSNFGKAQKFWSTLSSRGC